MSTRAASTTLNVQVPSTGAVEQRVERLGRPPAAGERRARGAPTRAARGGVVEHDLAEVVPLAAVAVEQRRGRAVRRGRASRRGRRRRCGRARPSSRPVGVRARRRRRSRRSAWRVADARRPGSPPTRRSGRCRGSARARRRRRTSSAVAAGCAGRRRARVGGRREHAGERDPHRAADPLAERVAGRERELERRATRRARREVAVGPRARRQRRLRVAGRRRHADAGRGAVAVVGRPAASACAVSPGSRYASPSPVDRRDRRRAGADERLRRRAGVVEHRVGADDAGPVRPSTPAGARSSAVAVERLADVGGAQRPGCPTGRARRSRRRAARPPRCRRTARSRRPTSSRRRRP